jgi:hypothetical protein
MGNPGEEFVTAVCANDFVAEVVHFGRLEQTKNDRAVTHLLRSVP